VAFVINIDAVIQGICGVELLRQRSMTAYSGDTKRLTGPFSHANNFSAYLSFTSLLFLEAVHEGKKVFPRTRYAFFLLGFFITLLCLVGTYSRGAWFAVGLTFLLYALVKRSWTLLFMIVVIGVWGVFFSPPLVKNRIVTLTDVKGGSVFERRELWGESLRMVEKSPWLGLGVNTYARNEPLYKAPDSQTDYQYAHNGYLQMMAEIGWLGLVSFLGMISYFFMASLRAFRKAFDPFLKMAGTALLFAIFSFLIHSATDTNLQSILLVNTLWVAMGVAWAARELCRKSAGSYS
jgi:O-antigen ligase